MKKISLLVMFICAVSSHAMAEPMTVDADKFELFSTEQRADFFGHVVVHRQAMVLKANQVRVWYKEVNGKKELHSVKATGNVLIDTPENKGSSDYATFSAVTDLLVLTGHARMVNKQGTLEGEQIEYNTATEGTRVLSGDSGKQVHFTFEEKASE